MRLLGYCLMTNHVHLVAIPERPESFARGLGRAHYLYTRALHQRRRTSGQVSEREQMVGRLTMENALLKTALARLEEQQLPSAAPSKTR